MILRLRPALHAAVALACLSSCGGSQDAPPAANTAAPPNPARPALVSLADLRASVPHMADWTPGEVVEQESPAPDPSTHVLVTFTRGTGRLDLEIADTGGDERAIESLEHMAGSDVNRTVGNGYFKGTTVGSFPAVESWNTVDKLGELSVLVRRRFVIHVAGSGLEDAAPMRALAEAVDTSRLK